MPDISDPTVIRAPEPEPPGATVVRPAPSTTDETLVRASTSAPQSVPQPIVSSGSAGFAEETRLLLRRRLLITHAAVGLATGFITLVGLTGLAPLPAEAGLGRWAVGLPLLAFGQSAAGLAFLL